MRKMYVRRMVPLKIWKRKKNKKRKWKRKWKEMKDKINMRKKFLRKR